MSQLKYLILACLLVICTNVFPQETTAQEIETIQQSIKKNINQSAFDIERNQWFAAEENLNSALELAEKIDDKKQIGIIHTKLAKIKYT